METNITGINVGGTSYPVNDPNVCDNFEDGNTASRTYNAGEFLIWKGTLYKVTTTIAQGATFTEGVNIESTTIDEVLNELNSSLSDKVDETYLVPSDGLYIGTIMNLGAGYAIVVTLPEYILNNYTITCSKCNDISRTLVAPTDSAKYQKNSFYATNASITASDAGHAGLMQLSFTPIS